MADRHRTTLKQSNKPFKPKGKTKPRSKSSKKQTSTPYQKLDIMKLKKADRKNQQVQRRKEHRMKLQSQKRGMSVQDPNTMQIDQQLSAPPSVVSFLAMNEMVNCIDILAKTVQDCTQENNYFIAPSYAQSAKLQFYVLQRNWRFVLDMCKVTDVLVVAFSCHDIDLKQMKLNPEMILAYDSLAYELLSAVRSQGICQIVGVLQGLDTHTPKNQAKIKRLYQRYFESEFPEQGNILVDYAKLLRKISQLALTAQEPQWKSFRAYFQSQQVQIIDQSTLQVAGFLNGTGHLSADQLVHITNYGTFQIQMLQTQTQTFQQQNPQSLNPENDPGAFAAEQTWPTEDELAEAMQNLQIVPTDHDPVFEEDDNEDSIMIEESFNPLELQERPPEERHFEDEVDTPNGQLARDRFIKYRGLKSFRTSQWNIHENLPVEYSKIFDYSLGHNKVKKLAIESAQNTSQVRKGELVMLTIANFPTHQLQNQPEGLPLIISGILPYEHKMSVLHYKVQRAGDTDSSILSKEPVIINAGFQCFSCVPTYSEDSVGSDKFKYLKKFNQNAVLSIFYPISFGPCNVLVFQDTSTGPQLVGQGQYLNFDPNRLIIKRILLTGYPIKIQHRKSVVRYMFLDPKDVKYFKPIELFTKKGLRGHIRQPVGLHGAMKCVFNDFIKHDDIVCLPLYKRVYPKWDASLWSN